MESYEWRVLVIDSFTTAVIIKDAKRPITRGKPCAVKGVGPSVPH